MATYKTYLSSGIAQLIRFLSLRPQRVFQLQLVFILYGVRKRLQGSHTVGRCGLSQQSEKKVSQRKNKDDGLNYDALMPRNSLYFLPGWQRPDYLKTVEQNGS